MSRFAVVVAWGLGGTALFLGAFDVLLINANHLHHVQNALFPLDFLAFAAVGAFIAANRPRNAIGWIFCAVGLANLLGAVALQYAVYDYVTHPGALPARGLAAWLGMSWTSDIGWALMALFVPLLFPSGRLLSPRWRIVAWPAAGALLAQVVFESIAPTAVDSTYLPHVRNPVAIEAARSVTPAIQAVVTIVVIAVVLSAGVSLVLRYRRGSVEERAQIKWFAYAGGAIAVLVAAGIVNDAAIHNTVFDDVSNPLFLIAVAALPVSAAIGILKYRLYDIDVLISRTLLYGSLTLSLLALYIVIVVLLQAGFRDLTGQDSDFAVALSTLIVAALFNPWRRRLQHFIDRRFYRRKYDSVSTLHAFTSRLTDATDLDALSGDLLTVLDETVQPATATIWLRRGGGVL